MDPQTLNQDPKQDVNLDSVADSALMQDALSNDLPADDLPADDDPLAAIKGVVSLADEEPADDEPKPAAQPGAAAAPENNGGANPQPAAAPAAGDAAGNPAAAPAEKPAETLTDADLELTEAEQRNLSKGSQARFQKLSSGYREATQERDALKQTHETLIRETLEPVRRMFTESRLEPQEIGELFEYGKAIKTGDFESAQKILLNQVRQFQLASGRQFQLADPLEHHPDLRREVDNMTLPEAHALEIARGRHQQQVQQQQVQRQTQQQQQQVTQQQQTQQVMGQVRQWSAQMQASDPQWEAKQARILAEIPRLAQTVPVNQLLPHLQNMYRMLEVAPVVPQAPRAPTPRSAQPLTSGSGGSGSRQPATAEEAAFAALGMTS